MKILLKFWGRDWPPTHSLGSITEFKSLNEQYIDWIWFGKRIMGWTKVPNYYEPERTRAAMCMNWLNQLFCLFTGLLRFAFNYACICMSIFSSCRNYWLSSAEMDYGEVIKMDKLVLRGLKFHGFHGVKPEEKKLGQKFLVDVDAWMDLQAAGKSDNLSDTISYTEIYRWVTTANLLLWDRTLDKSCKTKFPKFYTVLSNVN